MVFLLVSTFICLWNHQLYAYFLCLAFYSFAPLWRSKFFRAVDVGLCESVTFVGAVFHRQPNNRLRRSVTSMKVVCLFKPCIR